jgi:hypothetical protein
VPWYPYTSLVPGDTPRPFLHVWRDPTAPFAALIDSGADESGLPPGVASVLGVPFDAAHSLKASGAGGTYEQHVASADVPLTCVLGPLVLLRPAINPNLPFILLGRRDAFAAYRFTFDERSQRFLIEPYSTSPAS